MTLADNSSSEQYYLEAPLPTDVTLFQTPKRALSHPRYIVGTVAGLIAGWVLNYLIGLAITAGSVRVPLYHAVSDYFEGEYKVKVFGTAMWVELLITALFGIFLGVPITTCFIRADLKRGKAIPIQGNDLSKFRYLGVTFKNMWARGAYYCLPVLLVTYPILLAILELSCSRGGMKKMSPPTLDGATECYINRGMYSILKASYAAIVGLCVSPFAELGALNRDNLPEECFEAYVSSVQKKDDLSDVV